MNRIEKGPVIRETFNIIVKSAVVVGALGIIARIVNLQKLVKIKKVIFQRK